MALDANGEINRVLCTEEDVNPEDTRSHTSWRRELRTVKREGVRIVYPPDLDSYPESEMPMRDAPLSEAGE